MRPHDPFTPAERFAAMFRPPGMKVPETLGKVDLTTVPKEIRESIENHRPTPELRDVEQTKLRIAFYYANLAQLDDNVGKVLGALKELDLDKDTIVVF